MKSVERLRNFDLSDKSIEKFASEIYDIIDSTLNVLFTITLYNKADFPKIIERAVQNPDLHTEFNSVERISFTLPEWNTVYKRASTPQNTMFYGSPTIEDYAEKQLDYCRITISCEACDLLRQTDFSIEDNERNITFGQWEVMETLSLLTIIDPSKDYDLPIMTKLKDSYLRKLRRVPEMEEASIEFMTYIAQEFSKPVMEGANTEYIISAIFSKQKTNGTGFDGIIYPSVKAEGVGVCVALLPESVKKLKLRQVSQYKIIRNLEKTTIKLTKRADLLEGATTFKLLDIDEYNRIKYFSINS